MEWAPKVRVNMVTAGMVLTDDTAEWYGEGERLDRINATVPARAGWPSPPRSPTRCWPWPAPLFRHASGANLVVAGGGERPPYLDA